VTSRERTFDATAAADDMTILAETHLAYDFKDPTLTPPTTEMWMRSQHQSERRDGTRLNGSTQQGRNKRVMTSLRFAYRSGTHLF
jgi:hypothetical protein